jgi:hypothetical protein
VDQGQINGVIFLDLKKAFDTIDHQIIIYYQNYKLMRYAAIRSNGFNYRICVKESMLNSCNSDIETIRCGVPQGSNFGPLLFLIYINDLPNCLETKHSNLFAGDKCTISSCQGHLSIDIEYKLNKYLVNAQKWLSANKLTLNNEKIKCI